MSYLNLPDGIPDFNQAVISFWFRVPKASLDAARAKRMQEAGDRFDPNNPPVYSRLSGVVPLLTFGQLFEGYQINEVVGPESTYQENFWSGAIDGTWHFSDSTTHSYTTGPVYNKVAAFHANPSFIGIKWAGNNDDGTGIFNLTVFLQSGDHGNPFFCDTKPVHFIGNKNGGSGGSSPSENHWSYSFNVGVGGSCLQDVVAPGNPWIVHSTSVDNSDLMLKQNGPDSFQASVDVDVKPDTWHHTLISFDVSNDTIARGTYGTTIYPDACALGQVGPRPYVQTSIPHFLSTPCKIWIALDDKNATTDDDLDNNTPYQDAGPNDFISRNTYLAFAADNGFVHNVGWDTIGVVQDFESGIDSQQSTYTYPGSKLPTEGYPLGIPAGENVVDGIYRVEMAEFQMWTGKILDTSIVSNRRVFLAPKPRRSSDISATDPSTAVPVDTNLYPVNPNKVDHYDANDKPVTVTETLLGKKPDILLHRVSKWKKGENTGALGVDKDGNKIPQGQFDPTGGIKQYKPDPKIVA